MSPLQLQRRILHGQKQKPPSSLSQGLAARIWQSPTDLKKKETCSLLIAKRKPIYGIVETADAQGRLLSTPEKMTKKVFLKATYLASVFCIVCICNIFPLKPPRNEIVKNTNVNRGDKILVQVYRKKTQFRKCCISTTALLGTAILVLLDRPSITFHFLVTYLIIAT